MIVIIILAIPFYNINYLTKMETAALVKIPEQNSSQSSRTEKKNISFLYLSATGTYLKKTRFFCVPSISWNDFISYTAYFFLKLSNLLTS